MGFQFLLFFADRRRECFFRPLHLSKTNSLMLTDLSYWSYWPVYTTLGMQLNRWFLITWWLHKIDCSFFKDYSQKTLWILFPGTKKKNKYPINQMFPCRWVCKRMTVSMYRYYLLWKLKILAIHLCHFENSDKWKSETWWCVHILADRILFRSLLLKGAQSVLLEQSWVLRKKLLCFSSWLIIVNVLIWHSKLWTSHLWEGKEKKKASQSSFFDSLIWTY